MILSDHYGYTGLRKSQCPEPLQFEVVPDEPAPAPVLNAETVQENR